MLIIDKITKRIQSRLLLDAFALTVAPGELVAVVGESGAGKSTLLNITAGLEPCDSGAVLLEGESLWGLDDDQRTLLRRRRIGFVFQAFHILPYLTVAQNIELPLRLLAWPRGERALRLTQMLEAVGLAGRAAAWPRELSGGELQRVAIARALAHRPRLVLADEPTGNLDALTAGEILALLVREIRRNGAAGLMVTHSEQAAARCDRVVHLKPAPGAAGAGPESGELPGACATAR
jgi:putative ABC transport system ATP-binding protein